MFKAIKKFFKKYQDKRKREKDPISYFYNQRYGGKTYDEIDRITSKGGEKDGRH